MLQWSSNVCFKDKPACTLHYPLSTITKFSWRMCGSKLCWTSFIFWASTSNVQLFLSLDTPLGDYQDSKDSEPVVKRVNNTRWCARADATMALSKGYSSFQEALQVIAEDMTQKLQVIHEVKCLLKDLSKKENTTMAGF
ncbi:uncharacterized protein TNCT_239041 [Trichonephila clavata]|uniref:Uncharacterized protein n=1 Tax=Trichonephila clavata TaxID=2740835 RepID=A0A8X6GH81_TRICU|nr:uncharacterized protein TNCT_239041 [Trichonephila clavata]